MDAVELMSGVDRTALLGTKPACVAQPVLRFYR
jgi:hypothetical protein